MNPATGEVVFDDGEFELTSADGDTVHGTYTNGHGNFRTGLSTYDWTFDGGTGRYASVVGHGSAVFQITNTTVPPPWPFVDTGHGVISYDASQRRR